MHQIPSGNLETCQSCVGLLFTKVEVDTVVKQRRKYKNIRGKFFLPVVKSTSRNFCEGKNSRKKLKATHTVTPVFKKPDLSILYPDDQPLTFFERRCLQAWVRTQHGMTPKTQGFLHHFFHTVCFIVCLCVQKDGASYIIEIGVFARFKFMIIRE